VVLVRRGYFLGVMKTSQFTLMFLAIASIALGQESEPWSLSFEEASTRALGNNALIDASQEEIEAAEQGLQAAWGKYVPKVKVRSFLSALPEIRGDAVGGYTNTDPEGWGPFFRVQVTTTMPLYGFGQLRAIRDVARSERAVAFAQMRLVEQELVYQTHRAMEGWRLARSLGNILEEGRGYLQKARERLEELEEEDSEDFDQIDLLKLRVYESELVRRETETAEGKIRAKEGLRLAMGAAPSQQFRLKSWKLTMREFELASLPEYQERARQEQAELMGARAELRERDAEVDEARTKMYPSLGVDSYYRYSVAPSVEDQLSPFAYDPYNMHEVGVGLTLSWDLNFGESIGRWNQSKALKRAAEYRYQDSVNKVYLQVAETMDQVVELRKLQATNKKALKAARAWLMAKSDLYDGGLCPLEELNDALLSYFDRKIGYEQAVHDHNVAAAHLERLVGALEK
jgi:outer membrane protein TolC